MCTCLCQHVGIPASSGAVATWRCLRQGPEVVCDEYPAEGGVLWQRSALHGWGWSWGLWSVQASVWVWLHIPKVSTPHTHAQTHKHTHTLTDNRRQIKCKNLFHPHILFVSNLFFPYRGYEGVVKNLMLELPKGITSYKRPVHCVHWNSTEKGEHPVTVECEDGERITADHVIVTVPLGKPVHLDLIFVMLMCHFSP